MGARRRKFSDLPNCRSTKANIILQIDEQKRTKDFSLDRAEDFAKPFSQQQLEAWLKAIQELQERNVQDTGHTDKLESRVANVLREWMAQTQAELEEKELAANKEKREKWLRTAGRNNDGEDC